MRFTYISDRGGHADRPGSYIKVEFLSYRFRHVRFRQPGYLAGIRAIFMELINYGDYQ